MPRTLPAGLATAMAGSFNPYFKIGFADVGEPIDNYVDQILSFRIHPLEIEAKFYANDPQLIHCALERGAVINSVETGVQTSRMFITEYISENNIHEIKAHVFDKVPISINADITYQEVIEEVCDQFDKTAAFYDPAADWLAYQFYPAGKQLILNDARRFFNLIKQKFLIFACDNGGDELLFFHYRDIPHSIDHTIEDQLFELGGPAEQRYFLSRDENGTTHNSGDPTKPLHNLGYLESTDAQPAMTSAPKSTESSKLAPNLEYQTGDMFLLDNTDLQTAQDLMQVIETFNPKENPAWNVVIKNLDVFTNTEGGAMPSTIERVSNYTPLNVSTFDGVLSADDNNLQAAMETIDEHEHDLGAAIHAATSKTTPVDADEIPISDSAASWILKKLTWANLKATLKTYFDTLYSALGHSHSAPDASVVTYTPAVNADWDSSADPGDVDNALDQLAERVTAAEAAGGSPHEELFGDGDDGACVLDGVNTFIWASLSGSTYTMRRNAYPSSLTVNNGITLICNGFIPFGATLTNNGTIHHNGNDASAGNQGTAPTANFLPIGTAGGSGLGSGVGAGQGSGGGVSTNQLGAFGGRGAMAWVSATTHLGRAGGTVSTAFPAAAFGGAKGLIRIIQGFLTLSFQSFKVGVGGGGGAKSAVGTACNSGGGGAGGNLVMIFFKTITNNGTISANGGAGGAAAGTGANAGGGGGGGGGVLILVYETLTNNGTISANGGTGGASVAGGTTPTKPAAVTVINSSTLVGNDVTLTPATAGIVPTKNTLYLLSTHQNGGTLADPTVSGWGLTWNKITSVDFNTIATPTQRLVLYYAYGTPTMDNDHTSVTVSFPNTPTSARCQVDEIQNASNTIVQSATNRVNSATTLTVTLAAVGAATAGIYGVFARSGGTAPVAGTNFALITQGVTPALVSELGYNDNTVDMTHTTNAAIGAIAIEIQTIGAMESGGDGPNGYVVELQV